ncbi:MAG: hypothetical protein ABIW85_10330 [Variovorax sp.]
MIVGFLGGPLNVLQRIVISVAGMSILIPHGTFAGAVFLEAVGLVVVALFLYWRFRGGRTASQPAPI